ncbi:chorismate mutase [Philodulcilactobacillus myokoensis]|uniref:Chorismate mutase n=1 Tax=Philodulcilactobacillus myokoensis TaxID=2929573 RepID=A0A9W6B263_9LACO|nr:chorismate mutase [Philodulcilactobacillus myokoensis]GLB47487.1 chorismate mutase [Philodulcilactobacillus myokoensis]
MTLDQKRQQIDQIDQQIVELLEQRFQIGKSIGEYKKIHHLPILNTNREYQVLERINKIVRNKRNSKQIQRIFRTIMNQTKTIE